MSAESEWISVVLNGLEGFIGLLNSTNPYLFKAGQLIQALQRERDILKGEVADLRANTISALVHTQEVDRLKADNENLIWNLAGCSTFALGYGIDEPYAENLARPAMKDVLTLRKKYEQLLSMADQMAKSLKRMKLNKNSDGVGKYMKKLNQEKEWERSDEEVKSITADPLEKKAEKIASPHEDWLDQYDYEILKSDITSALRSVREETLEEAAKVVEDNYWEVRGSDREAEDELAYLIRALKGKP